MVVPITGPGQGTEPTWERKGRKGQDQEWGEQPLLHCTAWGQSRCWSGSCPAAQCVSREGRREAGALHLHGRAPLEDLQLAPQHHKNIGGEGLINVGGAEAPWAHITCHLWMEGNQFTPMRSDYPEAPTAQGDGRIKSIMSCSDTTGRKAM